jgi:hypothetical protein
VSSNCLKRDPNEERNVANLTFKQYAPRGRRHASKWALYRLVLNPKTFLADMSNQRDDGGLVF